MNALPQPVALPVALAVTLGQHAERGRKPVQQDFHGACLPAQPLLGSKGIVAVLADGIGSSQVSQEASEAAVRAVLDDYYCTSEAWSVKRSMQRVLAATNSWLHAQTQRSPARYDKDRGYVCAVAVVVLKGCAAHVFHAGDVRVCRLPAGATKIEALTTDHRVHVASEQSYLSRALGFHDRLELDYRSLPIECGDLLVLTCDGVHEHIDEATFAATLRHHADAPDEAAHALVALASARGSPDNLTVQVLRIDALPQHEAAEAHRLRQGLPLPPLLQARQVFDGYRIERELHASHRSHLYLATDLESGATVALKTPSIDLAEDEAHLDRFLMEEWIAQRVRSAHVLRPHLRARPRSHLYAAMEHVQGRTLAQWMRDRPTPALDEVRDIVEQIARGLQAFHRMEMLHQDLRPENVMIDVQGTVKIIDFGSARVAGLVEADRPGTRDELLGTLQYTAPEYFVGEPGSERSDLFSLGVLAYQMLTGRLPYGTAVSTLRTRAQQQRLVYRSALTDGRAIPAWVDDALARAVHPQPAKRHEALSEFVEDLRRPNAVHALRRRAPLIEQHPLRFWKLVCLALLLAVIALAGMLHASADRRQIPAGASLSTNVTEKAHR